MSSTVVRARCLHSGQADGPVTWGLVVHGAGRDELLGWRHAGGGSSQTALALALGAVAHSALNDMVGRRAAAAPSAAAAMALFGRGSTWYTRRLLRCSSASRCGVLARDSHVGRAQQCPRWEDLLPAVQSAGNV